MTMEAPTRLDQDDQYLQWTPVFAGAIGGAAGAIIGGIAGGVKGAVLGAVIGGAAGVGTVYIEGNKELILDPGTEMVIRAGAPSNTPR